VTDRATVIRLAVAETGRGFSTVDGVNALVVPAGGGAVGTITDTVHLPSAGASTNLYANQWLNRPNASNAEDVRRLVGEGDYAAATGVLTHNGPDWTEAPLTGAPADDGVYLLTDDDINDWNRAINVALTQKVRRLVYVTFTPTTSGQRQYDPTASPISQSFITARSQIRGVEHHDKGDTAGALEWRNWSRNGRAVKWFNDSDVVVLDFYVGSAPTTDDRLRLVTTRAYDTVTAEATVIAADEEWLVLATIKAMADFFRDPSNQEDEWNEILRRKRISQRLRASARRRLGRYWGPTSDRDAFASGGPIPMRRGSR
jgi:hypothetical protein